MSPEKEKPKASNNLPEFKVFRPSGPGTVWVRQPITDKAIKAPKEIKEKAKKELKPVIETDSRIIN